MSHAAGPPWETDQREGFRGRFGEDVDAYDDTRPVAPDARFAEPVTVRHRFDRTSTAAQHAANLSTQSGVKELPPEAQAELVDRVRRRIESLGGTVTVHHLAVATIATRLPAGGERSS